MAWKHKQKKVRCKNIRWFIAKVKKNAVGKDIGRGGRKVMILNTGAQKAF